MSNAFDPNPHVRKLPRGGDYLEVKWRLVWLRDRHPDAAIDTDMVSMNEQHAVFKATVSIPGGGSATGWGSETPGDFRDYIEKAETKALGRALAALGFGTQFTGDELSEGERIVDSPVQRPDAPQTRQEPRRDAKSPAKPSDVDTSPLINQGGIDTLHGAAQRRNLNHTDVHHLVVARYNIKSVKELTGKKLAELLNDLKTLPDEKLADLVLSGRDIEAGQLPGMSGGNAVTNPMHR